MKKKTKIKKSEWVSYAWAYSPLGLYVDNIMILERDGDRIVSLSLKSLKYN